ncbi:unnamed protein product, partial [Hymenolepis diminuta]
LPETIIIDTVTRFSSTFFRDFCQGHNITHSILNQMVRQNDSLALQETKKGILTRFFMGQKPGRSTMPYFQGTQLFSVRLQTPGRLLKQFIILLA